MTKNKNELIDAVAEHIMLTTRGFKSPGEYPIEWDKTIQDSQISMVIEDISYVLDFLESSYGYSFKENPPKKTHTVSYSYGGTQGASGAGGNYNYYPPAVPEDTVDGVQTDVDIYIRTQRDPNLSQVKEFIERVELLGSEENLTVIGRLSFHTSISDSMAYQISCGDCGLDDILVGDHSCKSLNED